MLSDDDSQENGNGTSSATNGSSASAAADGAEKSLEVKDDDTPPAENVEARLDCLQRAFPKKVRRTFLFKKRSLW